MKRAIMILGAALAVSLGTTWAGTVEERDLDGDGIREAQVLFEERLARRTWVDRDRDGYMETVILYVDGLRTAEWTDVDRDGRPEKRVDYDFKGRPWRAREDMDHDGKVDPVREDHRKIEVPNTWAEKVFGPPVKGAAVR